MIFISGGKAYNFPQEVLDQSIPDYEDEFEAVFTTTRKLRRRIDAETATNREAEARMLMETRQGELSKTLLTLMHKSFKSMCERHPNIEQWLMDVPVEAIKHRLHGEFGQAFDLDNNKVLTCEDCWLKSLEYLALADKARIILEKNEEPASKEDKKFMFEFTLISAGVDLNDPSTYDGVTVMAGQPDGSMAEITIAEALKRLVGDDEPSGDEPALVEDIKPTHIPQTNRLN